MRRCLPVVLVTAAVLAATTLAACSSCARGGAAAREDLAILPKDATIVVSLNVARLRDTAVWRKLLDLRDDPGNKAKFTDFVAKCGFDPFQHLTSATFAFAPGSSGEEFAAVAHGTFDQTKILQCIKDRLGHDLDTVEHEGRKLYNDSLGGSLHFGFLDGKTMVAGGPQWARKVVDLSAGKAKGESARDNAELSALLAKPRTSDAVWAVGLVPEDLRRKLEDSPQLQVAKTMKDLYGSMDFATGLRIDLVVDLGSEADAKEMAAKLTQQLEETRKNPQVMMLGLSSMVEAIKPSSQGAAFRVAVALTQPQVDQLIERLTGAYKSRAGSPLGLPGMGAPGMMPPPASPDPSPTPDPAPTP